MASGLGSLKKVRATIERAAKSRIPTYLLDDNLIEERECTGGKATSLMQQLQECGAIFVRDQAELFYSTKKVAGAFGVKGF